MKLKVVVKLRNGAVFGMYAKDENTIVIGGPRKFFRDMQRIIGRKLLNSWGTPSRVRAIYRVFGGGNVAEENIRAIAGNCEVVSFNEVRGFRRLMG